MFLFSGRIDPKGKKKKSVRWCHSKASVGWKDELLIAAPVQILCGSRCVGHPAAASLCRVSCLCWAGECCCQGHPAVPAAGAAEDDSADLGQVRPVSVSRHPSTAGTMSVPPTIPFLFGDWDERERLTWWGCHVMRG